MYPDFVVSNIQVTGTPARKSAIGKCFIKHKHGWKNTATSRNGTLSGEVTWKWHMKPPRLSKSTLTNNFSATSLTPTKPSLVTVPHWFTLSFFVAPRILQLLAARSQAVLTEVCHSSAVSFWIIISLFLKWKEPSVTYRNSNKTSFIYVLF